MATRNKSAIFDGKPYIFFSYAHKDKYDAMPIVTMLQEEGFRVWYDNEKDEGLTTGDSYREVIAERIRDCTVLIAFISKNYCQQPFCVREFNMAKDIYSKPSHIIYFDEPAELIPYYNQGLEFWLTGVTGFVYNNITSLPDLRKEVHKIENLSPCNRAYDDLLPQSQQAPDQSDNAVPAIDGNLSDADERSEVYRRNNAAIDYLLAIVQKAIEDKRFNDAKQPLDTILQEDPANSDARYYQLLVKYGVRTPEELGGLPIPLSSADVRPVAIHQNKERRTALEDALTQNKNYQQYLLGSTHMKEGRYQAAISIFSTIPCYKDSDKKIAACREAIAQEELSAAYKREVKDGKRYLLEQLRLKEPDKYLEYGKLCEAIADKPISYLFALLFAGVLAAAGAGMYFAPDSRVSFWSSAVLSVLFGLFFCIISPIAGIGVIAVCLLLLFKFKSALAVIMIILAAAALLASIYEWRSNRKYKKNLAEKESYFRLYIKDFEETERMTINIKYANIPEEARKPLMSIDEAFLAMRERKL